MTKRIEDSRLMVAVWRTLVIGVPAAALALLGVAAAWAAGLL